MDISRSCQSLKIDVFWRQVHLWQLFPPYPGFGITPLPLQRVRAWSFAFVIINILNSDFYVLYFHFLRSWRVIGHLFRGIGLKFLVEVEIVHRLFLRQVLNIVKTIIFIRSCWPIFNRTLSFSILINIRKKFRHFFLAFTSLADHVLKRLAIVATFFQHLGDIFLNIFIFAVEQLCKFLHYLWHLLDWIEPLQWNMLIIDDFSNHSRFSRSLIRKYIPCTFFTHFCCNFRYKSGIKLRFTSHNAFNDLMLFKIFAPYYLQCIQAFNFSLLLSAALHQDFEALTIHLVDWEEIFQEICTLFKLYLSISITLFKVWYKNLKL